MVCSATYLSKQQAIGSFVASQYLERVRYRKCCKTCYTNRVNYLSIQSVYQAPLKAGIGYR